MKSVGYLISSVSVLLLGLAGWLRPDQAQVKSVALITGMAASILGMLMRYLSHRKEKAALALAMRQAEKEAARP